MRERDFPILQRGIAYLDNAATTQKPRRVIEAVKEFYERRNANIHRAVYALSQEATLAYEEARAKVAALINVEPENLVFTAGCTDSINLVSSSLELGRGEEVLLTILEHHANLLPWQEAARRQGARILFAGLRDDLSLDVEDLKRKITKRTRVLAITHVSNVTGGLTPLHEIIPYAKQRGVTVLVDGAQAVPHLPLDVRGLGCDFYAFSGHKMLGPTGIGCLYVSEEHQGMKPYRTGGDMIDDVTEEGAVFAERGPRRFEAGTPNIAGAIGLGAAAEYLAMIGPDHVRDHVAELRELAWRELSRIPSVTLLGPPGKEGVGVISFTLKGVHPHDVAQILDEEGVCIRSGKHCAHPLMARLGLDGTNRASFYLYNTMNDVARLVNGVKRALEVFS